MLADNGSQAGQQAVNIILELRANCVSSEFEEIRPFILPSLG